MPFDATHNFDGISWLNQEFAFAGIDFRDERLQPVFTFALIWNLVEKKACGRYANERAIRNSVDKADNEDRLQLANYLQYMDYFRRRYLEDHTIEYLYQRLNFRNNNQRDAVRRAFEHELNDINNIVYALLLIAYRIRNNLFHGEKELHLLYQQEELFRVINNLLTDYLNDINA